MDLTPTNYTNLLVSNQTNTILLILSHFTALVFNYELKQLEEPKNVANLFGIMSNSCIAACPASSSTEDETINPINQERSITGNGVFTRNVYNFKPVMSMEMQICEEPFKPAMVIDTSRTTYDTGYEVSK